MADRETRCKYELAMRDNGKRIEITIYDYIVYPPAIFEGEITAMAVLRQLNEAPDAEEIVVNINSGGGAAFEAFAIYSALGRHGAKVTVNIDGLAASAASIVAMAGDVINIAENAMVMIHQPLSVAIGYAADMRKEADLLDKMTDQLVTTYTARTKQSAEQVREWVEAETWFTAQEAKQYGFADNVVAAKRIAASFDLSRFRRVPQAFAAYALPLPTADTSAKPKEKTMSDTAPAPASAVTVAQLKDACPGADDAFIVAQLGEGVTLDVARTAWMQALQAKIAKHDEQLATLKSEHDAALAAEKARADAAEQKLADVKLGASADESPKFRNGDQAQKRGIAAAVRIRTASGTVTPN